MNLEKHQQGSRINRVSSQRMPLVIREQLGPTCGSLKNSSYQTNLACLKRAQIGDSLLAYRLKFFSFFLDLWWGFAWTCWNPSLHWGLERWLAVKNPDCSCRGSGFSPGSSQPPWNSNSSGSDALFCHLQALHACGTYTYTRTNVYIHKIKTKTQEILISVYFLIYNRRFRGK